MNNRQLRIRVQGGVDDTTAVSLGATHEHGDHGHELVFDYVDQAHLSGILVRLADLHISFDHVEIRDVDSRPD